MKCPKCQAENPETKQFCADCGTRLTPADRPEASFTKTLDTTSDELTRGTLFAGRYEIIDELGTGGMGKVYRVFDKKLDEEVALKFLKPEIAAEKRTVERFRNEIKIARKITHKNVCRTHDLGEVGKALYITMEYVRGEDLKRFLKRKGRLGLGQAVSVALQVADGLAEAHTLGIVHRDLKPHNIMIDRDGTAKIMDFGIARTLEAPGVTVAGTIIGTPEYMSPEQVEGQEADRRADIYSFGVTLYEMLAGRVPFSGDSVLDIAHKQKYEAPPDPRKFNPDVPDPLVRLVLRCLEKDRDKRYQSIEELLTDLTGVNEALPAKERASVRIMPRIAAGPEKPLIRRLLPVALVVLAVVTVVGAWLIVRDGKGSSLSIPTDKPRVAFLAFDNKSGDEGLDHLKDAIPLTLNTDLSQSKFLFVLPMDRVNEILAGLGQEGASSYTRESFNRLVEKGAINHVIRGSFTKSGEELRIDVDILKAGAWTRAGAESAKGLVASWSPMIDELTRKIKPLLELTPEQIAGDIDLDVGQITATPEALQFYIEANKQAVLKHDYEAAIKTMEKAVALDAGFAMAYRSLASWYGNLRNTPKSNEYLKKAFDLSQGVRVSDRERLIIQGAYLFTQGRVAEALQAYQKALELYTDDEFVHIKIAERYALFLMEWEKACDHLEVTVKNKTENSYPYQVLAISYSDAGMPGKARYFAELFLRNVQDNAVLRSVLSKTYVLEGKFKNALAEAAKACALDKRLRLPEEHGRIFLLRGDLDEAEKEFQMLAQEKDNGTLIAACRNLASLYQLQGRFKDAEAQWRQGLDLAIKDKNKLASMAAEARCYFGLAELNLALGRFPEGLKECAAADPRFLPPYTLDILKTRILAEMKSFEDAVQSAEQFRATFERILKGLEMRRPLYRYDVRMAVTEIARGNDAKAVEYCLNYKPWLGINTDDYIVFIEPLARAYFNLGEFENARREYELISTLTYGRINHGHIYAKSFYMLGQVYERLGKKGQARSNYRRFLDLWKDADPGLAEVEDARIRLARL
ncbi:MAG: protein kinase [Candidatus Aminicenantes bacterium]|nr:protein kinase [Candidatus Aminicenantes bacterium]